MRSRIVVDTMGGPGSDGSKHPNIRIEGQTLPSISQGGSDPELIAPSSRRTCIGPIGRCNESIQSGIRRRRTAGTQVQYVQRLAAPGVAGAGTANGGLRERI